jgi:hypothetical protein
LLKEHQAWVPLVSESSADKLDSINCHCNSCLAREDGLEGGRANERGDGKDSGMNVGDARCLEDSVMRVDLNERFGGRWMSVLSVRRPLIAYGLRSSLGLEVVVKEMSTIIGSG